MFYDLNVSDEKLVPQAEALGWTAFHAETVNLKNGNDLKKIPRGKLCAVESADGELLRKAAKNSLTVLLVNPILVHDFHKDDGLIRAVAEANALFEIPLSAILEKSFVYRAKLLAELRAFLKKCLKLRAKFVFTSRAVSEFDLKTPRETLAIGESLGLTREQAAWAVSEMPKLVV